MASTWASSIIGMLTTLTEKMITANAEPTVIQAMMNSMFSGLNSAISEPLKSGMPSKLSAKITSVERAQTISSTSSTKPKIAIWPMCSSQAVSESPRSGRSPRSSRWLTWYMPMHMNGPTSRKPPDSASVQAGACWNTVISAQPIATKHRP